MTAEELAKGLRDLGVKCEPVEAPWETIAFPTAEEPNTYVGDPSIIWNCLEALVERSASSMAQSMRAGRLMAHGREVIDWVWPHDEATCPACQGGFWRGEYGHEDGCRYLVACQEFGVEPYTDCLDEEVSS